MSKPQYLFVTEGGESVFTIESDPTHHDIKCVEAGILRIIRLSDMKDLGQDGHWTPIACGKLLPDPGVELGPYHAPAH